jgi:protein-disulfide isomerase
VSVVSRPVAGLTIAALLVGSACSGSAPPDPAAPVGGAEKAPAVTRTSCDELNAADRARADELLTATYIHACCDETLSSCLAEDERCLLAIRLAENICRRVAAGQDDERIELALSLRARMMQAEQIEKQAAIDLDGLPVAGDESAPLEVVLFAGPRGHNCARMTPEIHRAVSEGRLKGKAKLYLKPFPLRSNEHSKEAGVSFLAAQDLGALWPFVLYSYAHFDEFSVAALPDWAEAVGLDRQQLEQLLDDPALVQRLVASKKEGLDNGVESTPSFFIDGRYYEAELEIDELVDVLEELHDRSEGLEREP